MRQPRDVLAVERVRPAPRAGKRKPPKPGEKPRVNIIGPSYGTFNMPERPGRDPPPGQGIGAEVNMVFPLGSHLADVRAG
jgi:chlorophyllide a reductase subunit Z